VALAVGPRSKAETAVGKTVRPYRRTSNADKDYYWPPHDSIEEVNEGRRQLDLVLNAVIYGLEDRHKKVFYVGMTTNPKLRLLNHRSAYGPDTNLRILQKRFSRETPTEAERKWILHFHKLGVQSLNGHCYARILAADRRQALRAKCINDRPDVLKFFQNQGKRGGKKAAKLMTAEERSERARKAEAKSAEVKTKKAAAKKKAAIKKN
jgi:hypothetical protein